MAQDEKAAEVALVVLKASWGTKDVTAKVQSLAQGNLLEFDATNKVLGVDGWPGVVKSCVVVYSYNVGAPVNGVFKTHVAFVQENSKLTVTPGSHWPERYVPATNNDSLLYVYGAVYGGGLQFMGERSGLTESYVKDNSLELTANNGTFGDTWHGTKKSYTLVYSYGELNKNVQMVVVQEGSDVRVVPPK